MGNGVGQGVAVMALGGMNRDAGLLVDDQDVGILVNYGQGQLGRWNIPGRLLLGQSDGEDLARVQPVSGKYGFPSDIPPRSARPGPRVWCRSELV